MSFGQAVLASKAGASYVSLFGGRISDEGHDAPKVIKMAREWLDLWGYKSKIIVGSIREVISIQDAAIAGAHVITIPPQLMAKMVDHKYSRYTVGQFVRDGERAFAQLEKISLL
jgi:transaldolase